MRMIIQEPVQASIWHCLNNYDYRDATFLAERLYAEIESDSTLFLLATCYYRKGDKKQAYFILKSRPITSPDCRYLLALCSYEQEKYAEAESAIKYESPEEIVAEFGDQAPFVLLLLGKIASVTERKSRAIECWRQALKLNPFLWSAFDELCEIGQWPNVDSVFQLDSLDDLSMCQGHNFSNIESAIIPNTEDYTPKDFIGIVMKTPQQIFNKLHANALSKITSTPATNETPITNNPLGISGFAPFSHNNFKSLRFKSDTPHTPTFGYLIDSPKLTESYNYNLAVPKRLKSEDNLLMRKESILQNSKNLHPPSTTGSAITKTPPFQTSQNVRRSSRLFSSSSYSVKENSTSPGQNKFVTPKSPKKKTKTSRSPKFNDLPKSNYHHHDNNKKNGSKEKAETVTSTGDQSESYLKTATEIQKQSAEGLMKLMRTLGQAKVELSSYELKKMIETVSELSKNQKESPYVQTQLGLAYFELAQYERCVKYFDKIHSKFPCRFDHMDVYSTALWHLQKEVQLSALAQDLIRSDRNSPITWCVAGNCMSLHKEHDSAIKFFQRAVQIDPKFVYGHTLLGHEFITTEELDTAMSCFRNAVRLRPQHYNAWFGIGTIYSKQERFQLAELYFTRALSINPSSSIILCHIGVVQHALKRSERALDTLNEAVINNPNSPLCKFHRGSIYFALGRHAEALKELEDLKQLVPKESSVYYLIGKIHNKLGNMDLALMYFSWATDLDPKGASNQIKAAFDPHARVKTGSESEPPNSPTQYQAESPFGQQVERNNFPNFPEDSDESF